MVKIFTFVCMALIISSNVCAAGDPAAGKAKTAVCTACHGNGGVSTNPIWPNLAGQHAQYIAKQLHDFKDQKRTNPQMSPMAVSLTNQDIQDLGAYYASQKSATGDASPKNLAAGEKLYRAGNPETGVVACMACHGPDGAGNPAAKYPLLSGQHSAYIVSTLMAFKSETRANDEKSIMRIIAGDMTNAEIEAVANYIQGLH